MMRYVPMIKALNTIKKKKKKRGKFQTFPKPNHHHQERN